MNFLDMRTIIFTNVITDIICTLVVLLLWLQSRNRFAGTGLWIFDFAFQTTALLLIILRGSIPDWASIILANTFVIAGAILGYMALGQFVGKRITQIHNYIVLVAFICVHSYFTYAQPDLSLRNLNISIGLLIICGQCAWLMLRGAYPGMRRQMVGVGLVFSAYCLVSLIRVIRHFIVPEATNDFFHSGVFDVFVIITYQVLLIVLTFSLALMINQRLNLDIRTQEEKFSKAFHSSPYAVTITRLSDGKIMEVNEGFVNITGYGYDEVVGQTTPAMHLWDRQEDRDTVIASLLKQNRLQGLELQFRKKSGELITGLFSAEIIKIGGEDCIISSIGDITERKRLEQELSEMATHDALTGLPNRLLLTDHFEIALAQAQRNCGRLAVMVMDLDNFKTINDNLGHTIGDLLLQSVATRLTGIMRKSDTVARIGGDEFTVLLPEISGATEAEMTAGKILEAFGRPFSLDGNDLAITPSIGIAIYPENGNVIDSLLKNADLAMYSAKEAGRNNYKLSINLT